MPDDTDDGAMCFAEGTVQHLSEAEVSIDDMVSTGPKDRFNVSAVFADATRRYSHVDATVYGDRANPDMVQLRLSGLMDLDSTGKPSSYDTGRQVSGILGDIAQIVGVTAKHYGFDIGNRIPLSFVDRTLVDLRQIEDEVSVRTAYAKAGMPASARTIREGVGLPVDRALVQITADVTLYQPAEPTTQG